MDNYRIHLFNKNEDVVQYSEKLKHAIDAVKQTERDIRNTQDEKIKRDKEARMRTWMDNLEEQFGYRESPPKRKPNLLK